MRTLQLAVCLMRVSTACGLRKLASALQFQVESPFGPDFAVTSGRFHNHCPCKWNSHAPFCASHAVRYFVTHAFVVSWHLCSEACLHSTGHGEPGATKAMSVEFLDFCAGIGAVTRKATDHQSVSP